MVPPLSLEAICSHPPASHSPSCGQHDPTFTLFPASLLSYSKTPGPYDGCRLGPLAPWSPLQPHHPLVSSLNVHWRSTGLQASPQTLQTHACPRAFAHVLSAGIAFPQMYHDPFPPFTEVSAQMSPPQRPFSATPSKTLCDFFPTPLCFCHSIYHCLKLQCRPTIQFQNP